MTRLPAQWEEQEFIQIIFPHKNTHWNEYFNDAINNFVNIVLAIQKYQKVLIIANQLSYIKSLFKNKTNLTFVHIDSNDTWSRDIAGITVEQNNILTVLDFQFNGWGGKFEYKKDNLITSWLNLNGLLQGYKYKQIDFILEGGSIDSNGNNIILTTSKCLLNKNRNKHLQKKDIQIILEKYLGAKKVLWLDYGAIKGDDTDSHIDTLARFVNSNTIVYQTCNDKNDENYKSLKSMEIQLKTFTNLNDKKFKLIPLPHIKPIYYQQDRLPATYANFLIINNSVLVPTYKNINDNKALDIFQKVFPTRDIIGIDCNTLIKQHGSLHCVTMHYPKLS